MPRTRRLTTSVRATIVLDADGLTKLARRDRRVREMIRQEVVERGGVLVVPLVAVIQALVEGSSQGAIDEILAGTVDAAIDRERVEVTARLLRASGTRDVADALVAAEALIRIPSIVITSDPDDIRALLAHDPRDRQVEVWAV